MAIGSTIYTFEINFSDTNNGIYQQLTLRAARHSSESIEYLICRVLAFCMEYDDKLEFSKGLDDPSQPAIWQKDLTGIILKWVEIGTPSAEKLSKGTKLSESVVIYTHKNPQNTLDSLKGGKVHKSESIMINSFNQNFIDEICSTVERRNNWDLTISEKTLYLKIRDLDFSSEVTSQSMQQ